MDLVVGRQTSEAVFEKRKDVLYDGCRLRLEGLWYSYGATISFMWSVRLAKLYLVQKERFHSAVFVLDLS